MQLVVDSLAVESLSMIRSHLVNSLVAHKQWQVVRSVQMMVRMRQLTLMAAVHMWPSVRMMVAAFQCDRCTSVMPRMLIANIVLTENSSTDSQANFESESLLALVQMMMKMTTIVSVEWAVASATEQTMAFQI